MLQRFFIEVVGMCDTCAVILAAGMGKRMNSPLHKVLHEVNGTPMIGRIVDAARKATGRRPIVVVGMLREQVKDYLGGRADYAVQEQQLGTGHAASCAQELAKGGDYVVVLPGDMPLIGADVIESLMKAAHQPGVTALVLTFIAGDPTGYGRIVREKGDVAAIVEHKDATLSQRSIREVNASAYCFKADVLWDALSRIGCNNAQGEFYLTDCVAMAAQEGRVVGVAAEEEICMGVNDMNALSKAEAAARRMEG